VPALIILPVSIVGTIRYVIDRPQALWFYAIFGCVILVFYGILVYQIVVLVRLYGPW